MKRFNRPDNCCRERSPTVRTSPSGVNSLSESLLAWPTPNRTHPTLTAVRGDGVIDRAPGTEPGLELASAVAAVERLDRAVRVEHVPAF